MAKAAQLNGKKRNDASEPAVATKKVKTTPTKADEPKLKPALRKTASRTIVKAAPEEAAKPARKTRARAEDLNKVEEEPAAETKAEAAPAKGKKAKKEEGDVALEKEEPKNKSKSAKAAQPAKTAKKAAPVEEDSESESEEEALDDQTAALLAGFESSEDENEPEEDKGLALEKVPSIPNKAETKKALKAAQEDEENTPGVVYVGRVPHGFYEHQMRAYFSQFGDITHLRLSRNKLTGRSKHYAFIEFGSAAVADIVAKTMDKYLLFGHILQVRRIPAEQVHENLWKGEGKRFKVMPRNKIEAGVLRRGATREQWEKRVLKENKRRSGKADKLKEMGYEFDMPMVRAVEDVPLREEEGGVAVIPDGEGVKVIAEKEEKPQKVVAAPEPPKKETPKKEVEAKTGAKRAKAAKEGGKAKKARKST